MPVAEAVAPVVKVARHARRERAHRPGSLGSVAVIHEGMDPATRIDLLPLRVHQPVALRDRPNDQPGRRDRDLRSPGLRGDHAAGVVVPRQALVVGVGVAEVVVRAVTTAVDVFPPDERHVVAVVPVDREAVRVGRAARAARRRVGPRARVVHEGAAPRRRGRRAVVVAGLPVAAGTGAVAVEEAERPVGVTDEVGVRDVRHGRAAHPRGLGAEQRRRPRRRRGGRDAGRRGPVAERLVVHVPRQVDLVVFEVDAQGDGAVRVPRHPAAEAVGERRRGQVGNLPGPAGGGCRRSPPPPRGHVVGGATRHVLHVVGAVLVAVRRHEHIVRAHRSVDHDPVGGVQREGHPPRVDQRVGLLDKRGRRSGQDSGRTRQHSDRRAGDEPPP